MTKKLKGAGGHQSANIRTDEWLTPPELITQFGEFDLDPCAPVKRPWDTAKHHYTILDNGLAHEWFGRVWLNPPYGNAMSPFLKLMSKHANGLTLIFNRTDRNDVQEYCLGKADSMYLVKQRIKFYTSSGTRARDDGGAPSVLFAYGERNVQALAECKIRGTHIPLNSVPVIVVSYSPSWKKVVTIALNRLNGQASTQQIYELVERLAPDKVESNQHYKAKVRQILQESFTRISKGYYITFSTTIE
jgi:hypothetical protein